MATERDIKRVIGALPPRKHILYLGNGLQRMQLTLRSSARVLTQPHATLTVGAPHPIALKDVCIAPLLRALWRSRTRAGVRAAVAAWDALWQGASSGGDGNGAQLVPAGACGLLRGRWRAGPSSGLVVILVCA